MVEWFERSQRYRFRKSTMSARSKPAVLALMLVALLTVLPAAGQTQPPAGDDDWRFTWRAGGKFFNSFNSRIRVDATDHSFGTVLNLEDDLALEENVEVGRLDAVFWYGKRSSIALSYYDIERSGFETVGKDIEFGDELIPIYSNVLTQWDQRIYKLAYRYQFISKPRFVLGASVGVHSVEMDIALRGDGGVVDVSAKADVPLPLLGFHGAYRFRPRWRLAGTFEIFDVNIGDITGTFNDDFIALEYDVLDRIGIGFGFNRAKLKVTVFDTDFRGTVFELFDAGFLYVKGRVGPRDKPAVLRKPDAHLRREPATPRLKFATTCSVIERECGGRHDASVR